ncbi:putative transcription factor WD40-like family [Rosa chinensis]|uniref:Putative transcription factor WD40-like family n=1 Tax=Rosa chinensis TaxID=74649 RepID=A0A2P6PHT3_ROSCH|nr:putative transcription factor WD40-like family [Rosa chinensis]
MFLQKQPGLLARPLSRVQMSTTALKDNLLVAGGFQGELICKHMKQPGVAFCSKLTTDENAITNAVDIFQNPTGSVRNTSVSPDGKLVSCLQYLVMLSLEKLSRAITGKFERSTGLLKRDFSFAGCEGVTLASLEVTVAVVLAVGSRGDWDWKYGRRVDLAVGGLKGHLDYCFSSAWHPDGRILATGNQDTTCRLWDVRNLSESLAVLKGRMGAIRAIKFNSDGRLMAMAEPADFVYIIDTQSGYAKGQEIDLFGEIAGISFSPDSEALFVGVADRTYGSVLEFNKRHYNPYQEIVF